MKSLLFSILSVFFLLTTACSRGEFLFRFADDLLASKVDSYFDLTRDQKKELKADLRQDINTGKREAFPKVAKHLRQLEKDMQKEPVDPAVFASAYTEIEKQVKGLTTYFEETTLKTSMILSQQQINYFADKVRKDIREEEADPQGAKEKVEKRVRRSLEYFVGGISRAQSNLIKNFLTQHPYPWQLQNQSQEHVVKQFLAASQHPDERKAFVEKVINDYESVRLPEYRRALAEHQKAFIHFLVTDFWNSMPKEQRERFKGNLISTAEILERLAKQ